MKQEVSLNSDMQRRGAAEVTLGYEAYGLWTEVLISSRHSAWALLGYEATPHTFQARVPRNVASMRRHYAFRALVRRFVPHGSNAGLTPAR